MTEAWFTTRSQSGYVSCFKWLSSSS